MENQGSDCKHELNPAGKIFSISQWLKTVQRWVHALILVGIVLSQAGCVQLNARLAENHYLKALQLAGQMQVDAAVVSLDKALEANPDHAGALLMRGKIALDQGRYEQARPDLEKVAVLSPESAEIYLLLGRLEYEQQHFDAALADLDRAIQLDDQNAQAYYTRGLVLLAGERVKEAHQDFDAALRLQPACAACLFQRALLLVKLGDLYAARDAYHRAAAYDPKNPQVFYQRGLLYVLLDDHEKAVADFDHSLQLKQAQPEVYVQRGLSRIAMGQADLGLDDFNRALELAPENPTAFAGRARAYFELDQPAQGMQDLDQAIRLDALNAEYYLLRGERAMQMEEYAKAIEDFDLALRNDRGSLRGHLQRGLAYYHIGEYEKAAQSFGSLVELDPENSEGFARRGLAYLRLEDYKAAIADLTEAIRLDPDEPKYYTARGEAFYQSGNPPRCLGDIRKATALLPDSFSALFNLALALARNGDMEVAINTMGRAIEIEPDFSAYHARGDMRFAQEAFEKALIDYNAALDLEADHPEVLSEMAAAQFMTGDLEAAVQQARKALQFETDADRMDALEEWIVQLDDELHGKASFELWHAALTKENNPLVTGNCDTEQEIVKIHNQLRGSTEEYVTTYCVKFYGVYVLGHITRLPTLYQQFIFDEELEEADAELEQDERYVWPEEMQAVGNIFFGNRDLQASEGKTYVVSEIIFRRGMVGNHIELMYWETEGDALTAALALLDIDLKIIQMLLDFLPLPTGKEALKNIPLRLE